MDATTLETRAGSEVVHSVVIFSRHGDRTSKLFNTTRLTPLGQNQIFNSGQFYRSRYLDPKSEHYIHGVSQDRYNSTQVYSAAPDQNLLAQSAQAFLWGLYPPSSSSFETLGNGTRATAPGGDQYPIVHTVNADSPETIWLKGDDSCPQNIQGFGQFVASRQFKDLQSSTMAFYQSFQDILDGVIPPSGLSYMNAYEIFDHLNVGVIHNATVTKRVSAEELKQLRILADSREWALYGNITSATPNPTSVSGSTLANKLLGEITAGTTLPPRKMSVFFGSYDTFLSFFALTSLPSASGNFRGLPEYGSTIALELISTNPTPVNPEDFSVRFLFRNGTEAASTIDEYPLFGRPSNEAVMRYSEFRNLMDSIAIKSVPQWCEICNSREGFCPAGNLNFTTPAPHAASKGMKPEIAGIVGAMTTLAAIAIVLAVLLFLRIRVLKKRGAKVRKSGNTFPEKPA